MCKLICATKNCRKRRNKKEKYCYPCIYKRRKKEDPLKIAYRTLQSNAKRRGKEFTITFEYFCKFAIKVKYLAKKGITRYSYHIDRRDETKGYIPGNLQLRKNIDNIKKYLRWTHDHKGKPVGFNTETEIREPDDDLPF